MARVKLSEAKAKQLLDPNFKGVAAFIDSFDSDIKSLSPDINYVLKIDEGVKKRAKNSLIKLNLRKSDLKSAATELAIKGYRRFVVEPMLPHTEIEEHYLSIERFREGFKFVYSNAGGVEVEDNLDRVQPFDRPEDLPLDVSFINNLTGVMDVEAMSFLEINPLVVKDDSYRLLDAAVLVDSAGIWQASWGEADIVGNSQSTESEKVIKDLNDRSPAAFSFKVLNQDGAIWLLLSGGGASITIADEVMNLGKAGVIGNYGEYSGGPTREETAIYTKAVLGQAVQSRAKKKALVVAGGVANFTDVKKTFLGIIDALEENLIDLQATDFKVFVRRGGPNENEGLTLMESFLKQHRLYGSVDGSSEVLTIAIKKALEFIDD